MKSTPRRLDRNERSLVQSARLLSIQRAVPNDAQLCELLGADPSVLAAWRDGERVSPELHESLVGLDLVIELLSDLLEPDSILPWLLGFNAHLGDRRPVDVLRSGPLSDVIGAIDAQRSGAFA